MTPYARAGGLGFRVCVFFARSPEEELSVTDIMTKFDFNDRYAIRPLLRSAVANGLLQKQSSIGRHGDTVYSAGPALRRMIGEPA